MYNKVMLRDMQGCKLDKLILEDLNCSLKLWLKRKGLSEKVLLEQLTVSIFILEEGTRPQLVGS